MLLPIAPDEPRRLRQLMEEGLQSDLLIMTGGVSMGRYDLVEQVLAEMQAEFFFTGAKIQPGRPVVFGRVRDRAKADKYFFGLPGNPVSTMVTFELFARPILEALAGIPPRPLTFLHARLKSEIRVKPGLRRFLPAILSGRVRGCRSRTRTLARLRRRRRPSPLQLLRSHPARSRANQAGEWVAIMVGTTQL